MKQRLLIVEPSEVIVEGLKAILEEQVRFKLLEPEMNVDRLMERIVATHPDIVLINPTLVNQVSKLRDNNSMAVVALVYQYVEPSVLSLFHYIIDIREPRNRIAAIFDEALQDSRISSADQEDYELSDRETEVLVLIAQGLSSKEIADRLCISLNTVITHRRNIARKLQIHSPAGLTIYAIVNGLVDISSVKL